MVCSRCGRPLDGSEARVRQPSEMRGGPGPEAQDPLSLVCPWCHALIAPEADGTPENAVGVLTRFGLVAGTGPVLTSAKRRRTGTGPPPEC